ncbi:MAG: hypothetical protein PHN49_08085 [Candidatus Omnitrophica bacterium]|nr:hypothetical protein [Candidatus Omnitrophota bacterium]
MITNHQREGRCYFPRPNANWQKAVKQLILLERLQVHEQNLTDDQNHEQVMRDFEKFEGVVSQYFDIVSVRFTEDGDVESWRPVKKPGPATLADTWDDTIDYQEVRYPDERGADTDVRSGLTDTLYDDFDLPYPDEGDTDTDMRSEIRTAEADGEKTGASIFSPVPEDARVAQVIRSLGSPKAEQRQAAALMLGEVVAVEQLQETHILRALVAAGGNLPRTMAALIIRRKTLENVLQRLNITIAPEENEQRVAQAKDILLKKYSELSDGTRSVPPLVDRLIEKRKTLEIAEKIEVLKAIVVYGGNLPEIYRALGMERTTLHSRLQAYGMTAGRHGEDQRALEAAEKLREMLTDEMRFRKRKFPWNPSAGDVKGLSDFPPAIRVKLKQATCFTERALILAAFIDWNDEYFAWCSGFFGGLVFGWKQFNVKEPEFRVIKGISDALHVSPYFLLTGKAKAKALYRGPQTRRIELVMKAKGVTAEELAERIGVSRNAIKQALREHVDHTRGVLYEMTRALGESPALTETGFSPDPALPLLTEPNGSTGFRRRGISKALQAAAEELQQGLVTAWREMGYPVDVWQAQIAPHQNQRNPGLAMRLLRAEPGTLHHAVYYGLMSQTVAGKLERDEPLQPEDVRSLARSLADAYQGLEELFRKDAAPQLKPPTGYRHEDEIEDTWCLVGRFFNRQRLLALLDATPIGMQLFKQGVLSYASNPEGAIVEHDRECRRLTDREAELAAAGRRPVFSERTVRSIVWHYRDAEQVLDDMRQSVAELVIYLTRQWMLQDPSEGTVRNPEGYVKWIISNKIEAARNLLRRIQLRDDAIRHLFEDEGRRPLAERLEKIAAQLPGLNAPAEDSDVAVSRVLDLLNRIVAIKQLEDPDFLRGAWKFESAESVDAYIRSLERIVPHFAVEVAIKLESLQTNGSVWPQEAASLDDFLIKVAKMIPDTRTLVQRAVRAAHSAGTASAEKGPQGRQRVPDPAESYPQPVRDFGFEWDGLLTRMSLTVGMEDTKFLDLAEQLVSRLEAPGDLELPPAFVHERAVKLDYALEHAMSAGRDLGFIDQTSAGRLRDIRERLRGLPRHKKTNGQVPNGNGKQDGSTTGNGNGVSVGNGHQTPPVSNEKSSAAAPRTAAAHIESVCDQIMMSVEGILRALIDTEKEHETQPDFEAVDADIAKLRGLLKQVASNGQQADDAQGTILGIVTDWREKAENHGLVASIRSQLDSNRSNGKRTVRDLLDIRAAVQEIKFAAARSELRRDDERRAYSVVRIDEEQSLNAIRYSLDARKARYNPQIAVAVAVAMTNRIFNLRRAERLLKWVEVPAAFAEETKPVAMTQAEQTKETDAYSRLLAKGGSVVLPAVLFVDGNLSSQGRAEYLKLILASARQTASAAALPAIHFSGTEAHVLKQSLFSSDLKACDAELKSLASRVFKANLTPEPAAANRLYNGSANAVSVSLLQNRPQDEEKLNQRIPAFLVAAEELKDMNENDKVRYLTHLTQLQLLVAEELKDQLRRASPKTTIRILGEFLHKVGIDYQTDVSGYLKPTAQSLLSDSLAQYLNTREATASAA